ncbi:MAG: PDZ domain-containing protein [Tissierellia bacterium]|nr:PDZ domain-containing protein [Tissierellia bacterium]
MDEERRNPEEIMEIIEGIDMQVEEASEDKAYEEIDQSPLEEVEEVSEYVYEEGRESKKENRPKKNRIISYIVVALIASLIGGIISPFIVLKYMEENNMLGSQNSPTFGISDVLESGEKIDAITIVAQDAMNSVVGITTRSLRQIGFFQQEVGGVGSGVIVDSNGYILTNSHVIDNGNAKNIRVLFDNGDEKEAKVLWYDALLDLAIIKVDAKNLPVAKLGDSDKLLVGEPAIAIGNPLGLEFQSTVTSGIISGLHRTINVEGNVIEDLIQTDASINQGNSGGPLLNSKGEVVGINTAKISSAEGLGFAIPINTVKPILEQVIETGTYKTVVVGITGVEVELYERRLGVDISADQGVVVLEVVQNSPAYNAGLRVGDVIAKIDDKDIENMSQLKKALYSYKQGDKAKLTIIRNGTEEILEIEFTQVR